MEAERTTLADELRQVARNLDRAAGISAQYCASGHHTDAIRRAADRLGELEQAMRIARRYLAYNSGLEEKAWRVLDSALADRPPAPPDPDQAHVDELRRIMAADRPGGGS